MIRPEIPIRALSIRQPWAWLILNGHKDIENRSRPTKWRGPLAIHAGQIVDEEAVESLVDSRHPVTGLPWDIDLPAAWECGAIVGVANIIGCVSASMSPWFTGYYGYMIGNAYPIEPLPCRGMLGFFDWRRNL